MKTWTVLKTSWPNAAAALMLAALCTTPTYAQWVVFDPTNYGANILNELNTLKTTLNQATQIANELKQIALAIQNLQQLPAGQLSALLRDYQSTNNQLSTTFSSINGLATNLATVTGNYNTLFPSRQATAGLTSTQTLAQSQIFLTEARTELQGVDQVTAQVGAQSALMTGDLSSDLLAVNSASGDIQALQGLGQVQAQIATEIAQLNTLIMAMNQAQTTVIAQGVQDRDDARRRSLDLGVAPVAAPASPVAYLP